MEDLLTDSDPVALAPGRVVRCPASGEALMRVRNDVTQGKVRERSDA